MKAESKTHMKSESNEGHKWNRVTVAMKANAHQTSQRIWAKSLGTLGQTKNETKAWELFVAMKAKRKWLGN